MPRFYCEYCDVYLKTASQGCRKEHNFGRKHINNKIDYYTGLIREKQLAPPIHAPPLWLVSRMRKKYMAQVAQQNQGAVPAPLIPKAAEPTPAAARLVLPPTAMAAVPNPNAAVQAGIHPGMMATMMGGMGGMPQMPGMPRP
ncbi:unnamed protein product [Amoebophrya sp. A120]|nr:unnamed protein product [Amoebophrya sp. A120]|eukprot:GSA120T00018889001.1